MLPFLISAVGVSAVAAYTDYKTGLIPNWLTFGGILGGVLGHLGQGWWLQGFCSGLGAAALSLGGVALCSAVPALMFIKGGMGGGDVKLFAALGALCHPMLGIETQLFAFSVLALLLPAQLAYRGQLLRTLRGALSLLLNPFLPAARRRPAPAQASTWVRLGPAICVGALLSFALHGYGPLVP
jgi:prepilin peptidase CpaA